MRLKATYLQDTVTIVHTMVQPVERGDIELLFMVAFGILHPTSAVRVQWDLYILLLLITVCIFTPYMICFDVIVERRSALGANPGMLCDRL